MWLVGLVDSSILLTSQLLRLCSGYSQSPSSGEPRWQRRPDARPEEILEAAKHVFGESGYAGTKLEDVARRAGVSKGTLYLYFDGKEALFREMVRAKVVAALAHAEETVRTFDGSVARPAGHAHQQHVPAPAR